MKNKYSDYKMFIIVFVAGFVGLLFWHIISQEDTEKAKYNPNINAKTFAKENARGIIANDLINEIKNYRNKKPVLIYLYTTWCNACIGQFADFNTIAHNMQNSNLQIYSIIIDRNITLDQTIQHLASKKSLFFQPYFLTSKDGFIEFIERSGGNYNGGVPFFIIINTDGKISWQKYGTASYNKIVTQITKTKGFAINN